MLPCSRPLLPGDTELDQIHRIFSLLGCPSPRIWPDMSSLKTFDPPARHSSRGSGGAGAGGGGGGKSDKPPPYTLNLAQEQKRYPFSNLQAMFPSPAKIGDRGLECLDSMLTFDPKQRITVGIYTHSSAVQCSAVVIQSRNQSAGLLACLLATPHYT
jgi:hypothetical protein